MRPALAARLAGQRLARGQAGLERVREPLDRIDPVVVELDGKRLVNFCSNDYLGLATHPDVADAMARAARGDFGNRLRQSGGVGSSASALVSGYTRPQRELERALADFLGFEDALVVSSGYQANLAIGQALLDRSDAVLGDRLNHASLNDGARLAGARLRRYRHNDIDDARAKMAQSPADRVRWIASDGVFSMDGDLAPLPALAKLADRHDLGLWLDDAHGFGVVGEKGRGIHEHLGVSSEKIDAFVVTFGKSLGTQGAVIAADRALIEALVNRARGVIYSTAMAPPLAAATGCALNLLKQQSWRRRRLHDNIRCFCERAAAAGIALASSATAIQPIIIGDNIRALALANGLAERGFLARAIRPPTVPIGRARLRITLSAAHRPEHIAGLVDAMEDLMT
ncbi:MAG: 8-amino-7-oxononanoate synthase [Xanthomonadaceae bacterium]|nr:8-amino-7-oxononanoate synthase [Xanthomonadaceae bacterium]